MPNLNQPNIERKICVWTTKYERLLEMCIVQHVDIKSVFTFQPRKRLVSTTVESAKPAATFWICLLGSKNWQLCCLAVTVHTVLQERTVGTGRTKSRSHFRTNISANQIQAHANLNQKKQKLFHLWHNRLDTPLVDTVNQKFNYILILYTFSPR